MLSVADEANLVGNDQLGASTFACGVNGIAQGLEAIHQACAIGLVSADSIACGFVQEVGAGVLAGVRRGVGVLVVRNNHDERQLVHSSGVETFMERAG